MIRDWRFRSLRLHNWKSFSRVGISFQDRVFLVGPNAAGKTNFLDLFRFLHDLASPGGGFQAAVNNRGGTSAIRCLGARRYPDIEIHAELQQPGGGEHWEYDLAFNQGDDRRPAIRRERVVRGARVLLSRPDDEDRTDPERLTQTRLEQIHGNREFRELLGCFASIRYLHTAPQLVREPGRYTVRTDDPFGSDFVEQLAQAPERTRNARLRRIQEALRTAVPNLQEIELWRDERGTPHLRGRYHHWRSLGAWQTEERFSDGTLRLLRLLWEALADKGPLLIEEPEISLHPEIVRRLPQILARIQRRKGRQFFITTHSPDLLSDEKIRLEEVLLLCPAPEGTEITTAASHQTINSLLEEGMPLGDALYSRTHSIPPGQLTLFGEA